MSLTLYEVRAFTAHGQNGNPAGVVLDADNLDNNQMQAIAQQAGFSETAFVRSSKTAAHELRFFTPTNEIDLCGHATIASWSLLRELGMQPGSYTQQTRAGLLGITILETSLVFMQQNKATFGKHIAPAAIASLLGIPQAAFDETLQPQIVSTGVPDLFIPVRDKSVLADITPDLPGIVHFSREHNISSFHVFCLLEQSESIASARNFAPVDGIDEEAATGTSSGALLCYLQKYDRLPQQDMYRIEQGEAMGCLSYIYGTFVHDIVWIGGTAKVAQQTALAP